MRNANANIAVIGAERSAKPAINVNAEMWHIQAQLEPKPKPLATTYLTFDRSKDTFTIGKKADLDRCRKSRPTEPQATQRILVRQFMRERKTKPRYPRLGPGTPILRPVPMQPITQRRSQGSLKRRCSRRRLAKMDEAPKWQVKKLRLALRCAGLCVQDALQEFICNTAPIPDLGFEAGFVPQALPLCGIEDQHLKLGIKVRWIIILEIKGGITAGFGQ